jgi:hypothetical protein
MVVLGCPDAEPSEQPMRRHPLDGKPKGIFRGRFSLAA